MKLKFKLIKLNVPKEKKEIHKKPKYFIRKWQTKNIQCVVYIDNLDKTIL